MIEPVLSAKTICFELTRLILQNLAWGRPIDFEPVADMEGAYCHRGLGLIVSVELYSVIADGPVLGVSLGDNHKMIRQPKWDRSVPLSMFSARWLQPAATALSESLKNLQGVSV